MAKSTQHEEGETLAQRDRREEQARLVKSFLAKRRSGQTATQKERRAYERADQQETTKRGLRFVESIPKKLYRQWAGNRQTKILHDQAKLHGIPLYQDTVSLPEVILWIHNFLAENKFRLAKADSEDPLLSGVDSPGLERYRNAAADCKELERDEKVSQLVPRAEMHRILQEIACIWQTAEETATKDPEVPAAELLKEVREEFALLIQEVAPADDDDSQTP